MLRVAVPIDVSAVASTASTAFALATPLRVGDLVTAAVIEALGARAPQDKRERVVRSTLAGLSRRHLRGRDRRPRLRPPRRRRGLRRDGRAALLPARAARGVTSAGDERLPASIGGLVDLALVGLPRARAALPRPGAARRSCSAALVELARRCRARAPTLEAHQPDALLALRRRASSSPRWRWGSAPGWRARRRRPARSIGGALLRWMPVLGTMTVVQFVFAADRRQRRPGPSGDPGDVVFAPLIWLLWGALSLAGPIAALGRRARADARSAIALFRALQPGAARSPT